MVGGAVRRHQLERLGAVLRLLLDAHFDVGEGGNVFRNGIFEPELALFDQHHRDHAGDRLGHRKQAEDRVIGHRQPGRDVAHAEEFVIDRLAVLLDQQDRAGNLALRDLVAEVIADALEFLLVEMRAGGNLEGAFRASRSRDRDRQQPRRQSTATHAVNSCRPSPILESCREFSGRLIRHKGRQIQPSPAHAGGRWRRKSSRR